MASVVSLPLHLVSDILRMLDNVSNLPNALLSHPHFYAAYLDTPSLPLDILRAQISPDLLPVAITAYKSEKSQRVGNVETFLRECSVDGGRLQLSLAQALQVGRLDDALSELRGMFVQASLGRLYGGDGAFKISATETFRISRALYRFQIYRNLFLDREVDMFSGESESNTDEKSMFFDMHSPWVNEQMACVYDYVETQLTGGEVLPIDALPGFFALTSGCVVMLNILSETPAYRETVVNGFQRSGNLTEWINERAMLFQEQKCVSTETSCPSEPTNITKLSLHLPHLNQLLKASTLEEWQTSLSLASSLNPSNLPQDLEDFNRSKRHKTGIWRIENMDLLSRNEAADEHPRRMWARAHYDKAQHRFRIGEHSHAPMRFVPGLRALGYVMWDGERMEDEVCGGRVDRTFRGDLAF